MEELNTHSDSDRPMACGDCFFYKMIFAEVGESSLEILQECPGSIRGDGFCSTPAWKCGHVYARKPLEGVRPVDRIKSEIVALSALRSRLDSQDNL